MLQRQPSVAHQGGHRDPPGGQLAEVLLGLRPQLLEQRGVSAGRGNHLAERTAPVRPTQTTSGRFNFCQEKGLKVLTINLLVPFRPSRSRRRAALSFSLAPLSFFFPLFPFLPSFFLPERCFSFVSPAFVPAGIFGSSGSSSAVASGLPQDGETAW